MVDYHTCSSSYWIVACQLRECSRMSLPKSNSQFAGASSRSWNSGLACASFWNFHRYWLHCSCLIQHRCVLSSRRSLIGLLHVRISDCVALYLYLSIVEDLPWFDWRASVWSNAYWFGIRLMVLKLHPPIYLRRYQNQCWWSHKRLGPTARRMVLGSLYHHHLASSWGD